MRNTAIEWADDTVNFWWGCTQIGPGCDGCYAKDMAERFKVVAWNGPPLRKPNAFAELKRIGAQARREGRKRWVFVNSMSDFFDNKAPSAWRAEALNAIEREGDSIVALLLTKRVGNVNAMLGEVGRAWLPENVALGATLVNQQEVDRDWPKLMEAAVSGPRRFVSFEPLLSAIRLPEDAPRLGWAIVGGESGRHARPMNAEWVRDIRYQCRENSVPFLFKQWGEWIGGVVYSRGSSQGHALHEDGLEHGGRPSHWWSGDAASGVISTRIGKAAAGRTLSGETCDGRPQW